MELKYISEEERNKIPSADFAGPNHSFPINSQAHVLAAAHLYGRAEDPEKIKANIIKIARRKGYALPPEWQEDGEKDDSAMKSILVGGGAVKRIGDNKIGGHFVIFSDPMTPDLSGQDYFNADTDFDTKDGDTKTLYFQHGFDETLGDAKIGIATVKRDDKGLYVEAELKVMDPEKWSDEVVAERKKYISKIMDLVDQGVLGYSSGAVSHLVRREAKGNATWIKSWPLGEISLTHTPAEPRTQAVPIKSIPTIKLMSEGDDSAGGFTLGHEASMGGMQRLHDHLEYKTWSNMYDHAEGKATKAELLQRHAAMCDNYKDASSRLLGAMVPDDMDGVKSLMEIYALSGDLETRTYTKELGMLATASEAFIARTSRVQEIRANANRTLSQETVKAASAIGDRLNAVAAKIQEIVSAHTTPSAAVPDTALIDEIKLYAMQAEVDALLL